jgi:hypothetical protein
MSSGLPEPYETGLRTLQGSGHIGAFLAALLAAFWIILSQAANIDRLIAWLRPRKDNKEADNGKTSLAGESQECKHKPDLAHEDDERKSKTELHPRLDSIRKSSLPIPLVVGMPYSVVRYELRKAGWQHMALPAYGYNEEHPKVMSECPGHPEVCNSLPELEACSSQGHCRMRFHDHEGNQLIVSTYGPVLTKDQLVRYWWIEDK